MSYQATIEVPHYKSDGYKGCNCIDCITVTTIPVVATISHVKLCLNTLKLLALILDNSWYFSTKKVFSLAY